MVKLVGSPRDVGLIIGEMLAPFIHARLEVHETYCAKKGRRGTEEANALHALLKGEVPHWLEEYQAVAEASGVDFGHLLEVNCAAPLTSQPSCTSAMALGGRSASGYPVLLKVRDERPQHQAMGYRRIDGVHGMLFGTDGCNLGVGQGCNEHGLAVANNSGGLVPESALPIGFNDCHMTRLLLERATTCGEALDVFRSLMERGKVGLVDGVRGMIFLIADREGKGLVIEATRDQLEFLEMTEGLAVWSNHWLLPGSRRFTREASPDNPLLRSSTLRYERGMDLLKDRERVSTKDLEAFARDEANAPDSICNGSDAYPWRTVSAFAYALDPGLRRPVRVAQGLPTKVDFRDVPLWADDTPEAYLLDWTG